MKKIVFVLPHLNAGGAERVAINYIRQLDLAKFDVTLVLLMKSTELLSVIPSGVRIVDLGTFRISKSFFALTKVLWQLKPDVLFTTHSNVSVLLFAVRPFVPRFRYIARIPSMPSLEKKYSYYSWFKRFLFLISFRCADLVIAQTEAMKLDAINSFRLKGTKIKVLANPVDKDLIDSSCEGVYSLFPKNEISAVACGRLTYAKGFDILISCIPQILEIHKDFVLYIIGNDVGEGDSLRGIVEDLGLADNVIFLGFQENPYRYYSSCDLFVLSSRWEGFPNTVLENYYLNTPIVATRCVPVISELISDGVNGYTCEPENIVELERSILSCIKIKRSAIRNKPYSGSKIKDIL